MKIGVTERGDAGIDFLLARPHNDERSWTNE